MAERTPQDQDKYVVRFPDGMRDRLKEEAAKNNRSLNAEIIDRLQATLDYEPPMATDEVIQAVMKRLDEIEAEIKSR